MAWMHTMSDVWYAQYNYSTTDNDTRPRDDAKGPACVSSFGSGAGGDGRWRRGKLAIKQG